MTENMATSESPLDVVLKAINEKFETRDPVFLAGIFVSVVVVILTIIFLIFRGKSSSKRSILLVGLCDSGKTTLFSRLVYDSVVSTQTSMKENSGIYIIPTEKRPVVSVIDIPGHERVRSKFFDQFKSSARALVFVIDSLTFQKDIKDVAELLYNVLTDAIITQNALPVLVACNKHDQALAKGSKLIRSALEKELNNVRMTRSASLSSTDGNRGTSSAFLGKKSREFTFADVKPMRVEFAECSAKGGSGKDDLQQVQEWIIRVA